MKRGKYKIQPHHWDKSFFYANLHELENSKGIFYSYYITTHRVTEKGDYGDGKNVEFEWCDKYYASEVRVLNN